MNILVIGLPADWCRWFAEQPAISGVHHDQDGAYVDGANGARTEYRRGYSAERLAVLVSEGWRWHSVIVVERAMRLIAGPLTEEIVAGADAGSRALVRHQLQRRNLEVAVRLSADAAVVAGEGATVDFVRELGRILAEARIPIDALASYGADR